jgi:hypothetical protein
MEMLNVECISSLNAPPESVRTVEPVHRYDGFLPVRNIDRVLHLAGAR